MQEEKTFKKIVYIDMDNVIVDFPSAFAQLPQDILDKYADNMDEVDGIFSLMKPMRGAVQSVSALSKVYDVYILSTAPWENPSAWSDKLLWVKKYLGDAVYKRLILSHNKHLNAGDYLIDDRTANGADRFTGEHLHFGTERFPDWRSILEYLDVDLPPALMTEEEIQALLDRNNGGNLRYIPKDKMTKEQEKAFYIALYRRASSHCIQPDEYDT